MKQASTLSVVDYQNHLKVFAVFTLPSDHISHNKKVSVAPQIVHSISDDVPSLPIRDAASLDLNPEDGSSKRLLKAGKHQAT
jgi:hypothetical protein